MKITTVELWSDGACKNNGTSKAVAAYGTIVKAGNYEKEIIGRVNGEQTNNRAELAGVIAGLSVLKYPCTVKVYTDSQVVCCAPACISRGYRTSAKKPAANIDLLKELATLLDKHSVTFEKVTGHTGINMNERCDALASKACFT